MALYCGTMPSHARVTLVHRKDDKESQIDLGLRVDRWDMSWNVEPLNEPTGDIAQQYYVGSASVTLTLRGTPLTPEEEPLVESDGMRLARAVLAGDGDTALLLADDVQERHLCGHRGTPYLSRQQMADRCLKLMSDVATLREALRPFADAYPATAGFAPDTPLVYVGPDRCSLTNRDLGVAAKTLEELDIRE